VPEKNSSSYPLRDVSTVRVVVDDNAEVPCPQPLLRKVLRQHDTPEKYRCHRFPSGMGVE
jgi:hypothetical protein